MITAQEYCLDKRIGQSVHTISIVRSCDFVAFKRDNLEKSVGKTSFKE